MNVNVENTEDAVILSLTGDADAAGLVELSDSFKSILEKGFLNVVLDLEGLRFINSQCIGVLMNSLKEIRSREGDIVLAAVPPNVDQLFKVLGFKKIFKYYDTVEDAITHYAGV